MAEELELEELRKELENERDKIKRLEELLQREEAEVAKKEGLLNELYQRIMVEGVTDKEEIAKAIGREQYDALTYHLAKEHERRLEAERKLIAEGEQLRLSEKQLVEDEETIKRDEQKIMETEEELSKERKKRIRLEKQLFKDYQIPKPEAKVEEFVDDFDLTDIEPAEKPKARHTSRSKVTTKDLIKLMLRINRIKAIDASIMLNTTKKNVLRIAEPLANKGYLEIENPRTSDPTIQALKKLIKLKKRRK